jgi:phosphate-selective porin
MGPAISGGPQVQLRFRTGYGLLSWSRGSWRLSARVDGFDNDDRDGTAEPDQESGRAVTAAAFWQPRPFLRVGLEYLELWSDRPAASFSGADANTDARRLQGEVRLRF